jgi:hypothetical protein
MLVEDGDAASPFSCDPEIYKEQLEELIALQAIFGEEIRWDYQLLPPSPASLS